MAHAAEIERLILESPVAVMAPKVEYVNTFAADPGCSKRPHLFRLSNVALESGQ